MRFIITMARFAALPVFMILMAVAPRIIATDSETIAIFASDCATEKASFNLGERVCAIAVGSPLGPPVQRRFEWIAPDGTILQIGPEIVSDPQSDSLIVPSSGAFAQVGTWTVKTVDASNNGFAVARFIVQDANKVAADLSVNLFAPFQVSAGTNITFSMIVKNSGPNEARNVEIKIGAASNSTLLSAEQTAGPRFAWAASPQDASRPGICSIALLPVNAEASFALVYQIEPRTPNGATVASVAHVSSSTFELYPTDNTATAASIITPQPCALTCPGNIAAQKEPGQCGAIVSFARPAQAGSNCGALVCNPPSGSFFPSGATPVTCVGNTGVPCSFSVIVDDPQPPALACPSDITAAESSPGMGLAIVKYKLPTANGSCPVQASACAPPSGSSFPVGATVVNCETSNAAGAHAVCSFTVTVESSSCSLICPSSIARSNKPTECGAAINYAAPKTTSSCGAVTCAPPSGAFFPIGTTTVSCSSKSGASGTFEVTVQDTQTPVIAALVASPPTLPSPDRKMRDITISYNASDNCSDGITCSLGVASNEPVSRSETGSATSDWEIIDSHHVRLRADRADKNKDRIYTITITCSDSSGNSSDKTVTVSVPRKRQ